jgi:hypothetical protein
MKHDCAKDKMRVIERNLMEMYERIKEVEEMPSQYAIVKRSYLSRGDSPWPKYLANLIFMHHVII